MAASALLPVRAWTLDCLAGYRLCCIALFENRFPREFSHGITANPTQN